MSSHGKEIAIALGKLLRRDVRQRIYVSLTDGVGEGVNESTYPVLSGLERCGSATAAELSAVLGLDRSVVSRHATTLEEAGLLNRAPDERDRRWTALTLTDAGKRAVEVMRERLHESIDDFLSEWPDDQVSVFTTILTAFTTNGPIADRTP
ncbi:MarR family winged helix-turn-helix transcriptional regulator [Corynebacterium lizhenjunii]|uniref:MarR family winged helix-turn-helix transcriptional regulator n=1 Tax=Corynebacterium lizhenjunii TaxID=2709394 RepID=UPI0013EC017F|nr:MarR family transcriptional regulator [Corynebacterium lizhenjunii]